MASAAEKVGGGRSLATHETEFTAFGSSEVVKLSVNIVRQFLCSPTKNGQLPSDKDAVKFILLCRARQLNPFEGDAYLQGFDGKDGPQFSLITAHQAFLKRAQACPEFDGMESGVIVKDGDGKTVERQGDFFEEDDVLLGGWARVYVKGRKVPWYKRLKLTTFNSGRSRWEKDPGGMIVKCAEADALRSAFPLTTAGMYLREEMDDRPPARLPPIRDTLPLPLPAEAPPQPIAPPQREPGDEPDPSAEGEPVDWEALVREFEGRIAGSATEMDLATVEADLANWQDCFGAPTVTTLRERIGKQRENLAKHQPKGKRG